VLEELPFDQYQRYGALRLAADDLRARLGRPLRILDVGDWDGLVARFCPDDLTVWAVLRKAPPLPFLPESVHGTEIVVLAMCYAGAVKAWPSLKSK